MNPTFLSIDQSTSATKAILFDANGGVVAKHARDHRQIYPQPGWVEHDAEEIWQNTLHAMKGVLDQLRGTDTNIAALNITNQRETVVVFEQGTGRPLHHAIVWQCRRSDSICDELRTAGAEPMVRDRTGLKIDSYFSASKLAWLVRNRPEIAQKLRSGEALIGTIDAYLIYRLTRGRVFATDHTNASRTLLFDIGRLQWDEELCTLFGVRSSQLPEVRACSDRFGESDAGGLLASPVPICGVLGDSQAALFAQRCYAPGTAKATFGTGTSLLLNIGDTFTQAPPEQGTVTTLAWVTGGRPTYAFEGLINYSAATLSWLKDQLGLLRDIAEAEPLATSVPDNGGVYIVPAFAGLGAPHWRPGARAALIGMTAHTRREHVVRAGLESIAYQVRDLIDMMRANSEIPLARLYADGGPTRNAFLMQFTSDITGVEIVTSDVPESSALGATMAGMLGLGHRKSMAELGALPRASTVYRPAMPRAESDRLQGEWRDAVRRIF